MEKIEVTFAGKKKVHAKYKNHIIKTDQEIADGGDDSAPTPFDLFLASLATCTGTYLKSFCEKRNIPTEGIRLLQSMSYNKEKHLIDKIDIDVMVPVDFPVKYKNAIIKSVGLCAVKKHLLDPPEINLNLKVDE